MRRPVGVETGVPDAVQAEVTEGVGWTLDEIGERRATFPRKLRLVYEIWDRELVLVWLRNLVEAVEREPKEE